MKKADNFDPSKWLVENKITFQSRLNENEEESEIDTVGESDTSGINSGTYEEETPEGGVKQWNESKQEYQIEQRKVKESW